MSTTLDDWIAREAIPFSPDSSESFNAAVDLLMDSLDDSVRLLGLGEAMHGSEEILILRNRLFQRLVEKHGYSAIAIESSFPRGRIADDYINGRGASSFDEIADRGFSHGFGRSGANRQLIEWMRQYNADPSHHTKLHFYGFDSPTEMTGTDSPRQLLYFALNYLEATDGSTSPQRARIDQLLGNDADWENPAAMMDPSKSIGLSPAANSLRIEADNLITELNLRRPELIAKTGRARFLEALRYAMHARQMLNYHAILAQHDSKRLVEGLGLRDVMMADNLAYIVERENDRGKVFAFAHNSHLKIGQAQWQLGPQLLAWWPAGSHVRHMLGEKYAVIGSAVGVSEPHGLGQPEANSLESFLMKGPGPAKFVPIHHSEGFDVSAVITRCGSTKNPTYFPLTKESLADFDWLLLL